MLERTGSLLSTRDLHGEIFLEWGLPSIPSTIFLEDYAEMHHVGPDGTFLPESMELLRRKLEFKESHIGNVRYGNEARLLWGACPGMSKPEFIVESLSWVS